MRMQTRHTLAAEGPARPNRPLGPPGRHCVALLAGSGIEGFCGDAGFRVSSATVGLCSMDLYAFFSDPMGWVFT